MKKIKLIIKTHYKYPFIFFSIVLVNSILNLLGLSKNITNIIFLGLELFTCFSISFLFGKHTNRKAIVEGLIIGTKIIFTFFVFGILVSKVTISSMVLYLLMLLSSVLGAIYGKNKTMK